MKREAFVLQDWVCRLSFMQQTVLLTAIRGPDGVAKYHPTKFLLRWYRRCILLSALDGKVLTHPAEAGGGSFTGPAYEIIEHLSECSSDVLWQERMDRVLTMYLRSVDELPHHFQMHLMHAAEIIGFKHSDADIRCWWNRTYHRLVHDLHLWPETEEQLDIRLGDSREGWLSRADFATTD